MTKDFQYTKEVEPIIKAYDKIFDSLCCVWAYEYVNPVELRYPDGEWLPIIEAYEKLNFSRIQSLVLPQELRYLVPSQKTTSKSILERRKITGKHF